MRISLLRIIFQFKPRGFFTAVSGPWPFERRPRIPPTLKFVQETKMASSDGDDSLYPIAVLIDELRNEDVQVGKYF